MRESKLTLRDDNPQERTLLIDTSFMVRSTLTYDFELLLFRPLSGTEAQRRIVALCQFALRLADICFSAMRRRSDDTTICSKRCRRNGGDTEGSGRLARPYLPSASAGPLNRASWRSNRHRNPSHAHRQTKWRGARSWSVGPGVGADRPERPRSLFPWHDERLSGTSRRRADQRPADLGPRPTGVELRAAIREASSGIRGVTVNARIREGKTG